MKSIFKYLIFSFLSWCAKIRLERFRRNGAHIIGVTGSIGKTTCKEAVAHVLRGQFRVLSSSKSYNTELGLPLTILELKSEFSSVIGWAKNLIIAFWRGIFDRTTYDILVLEMGVDKPGDMDVLLKMVTPDVGIFTGVHPVHLADGQFGSLEEIFEEKSKLIRAVGSRGTVILNQDDERCAHLGNEMSRVKNGPKIIMFGMNERSKLYAEKAREEWGKILFDAHYGEVIGNFEVPILGIQHISSLLPAIGCGLVFGMYMLDITNELKTFRLPPGRLSLIEGMNASWIIDSSYNASPDAVRAAIHTLTTLFHLSANATHPISRRVFVFGNMNELGTSSEKEHREIATSLKDSIDVLITVGNQAQFCADETLSQNILPRESIYSFSTTDEAISFMPSFIQPKDLILIKGSQNNVRLEWLAKAIMAHPDQAEKLLARQEWKSGYNPSTGAHP
ncbi:MAG: UDP-N-acetylmuramoyl-tripeptide--D-alanyl-D-alanine ligase [Candidatus Gracilibacteria bacterium]